MAKLIKDLLKVLLLGILVLVILSSKLIGLVSAADSQVSRNWAGYIAQDGQYTQVSASWVVPVASGGLSGVDAAWVGIGGVSSNDLIQAGTQETVVKGSNDFEAFYEELPNISKPLDISINGDDSVSVSISQTSNGVWSINFNDKTTNQSVQKTIYYNSSLSSADWIEEAPSGFRNILPLDNFGSINFENAQTIKNGQNMSASDAGSKTVTMSDEANEVLASTSNLGADGESFSVNRTSTLSKEVVTTPVIRRFSIRPFQIIGSLSKGKSKNLSSRSFKFQFKQMTTRLSF